MNWDIVLQYLPDGLCFLLCFFGCLCNWVRTGSMKKLLQSLCPSSEPLKELEARVDELECKLDDISHAIESAMRGDVDVVSDG